MHYTLHQLHIFLEIVNKKSITKASEALFLTQPAVSIQLKKFQNQFPIPLTEVIGRQLYVTSFGEEIASAAKNILTEAATIEYKTKQYEGKLAGKISFSIVSTGKYLMPYYLASFLNKYPDVDFTMDVTNKQNVVRDLEQNRVDFALVSVLPEHLDLKTLPLLKNSLVLVGGKKREAVRKGTIKDIFINEPMIYREKGSATRTAMENFIKSKKFPVSKKIELTSNEALKQAVIAGLGYSIMPLLGIQNAVKNNDIKIISYKGLPLETQWNIVWLKQKKISPLATAFIDHLESHKSAIQKEFFPLIEL